MRTTLLALGLVACKATSAPPDAGPPPPAASSAPAPEPKPTVYSGDVGVREVVRRWNEAHASRDARALESVYADSVSHYGTELSRPAVVKAKATAFVATPDFTQSIGMVELEPGLNSDQAVARFTKTVTQKGKAKDYPAVLVIRRGLVEKEDDDVDWCRSGDGSGPNDRVVPPFTMSGREAMMRAHQTKHLKEAQKSHSAVVIDIKGFSCPKVCETPSFKCGFNVRTSDLSSTSMSNLVEWLYIDPVEKKLWFKDYAAMNKDRDAGEIWTSEPLPPLPAEK